MYVLRRLRTWHAAGLLAADALSIEQVALHARCQSRNSSVEPSGSTTAPILQIICQRRNVSSLRIRLKRKRPEVLGP